MNTTLVVTALCAVFTDPSFYISEYREAQVCRIMPTVISEAKKNNLDPFLLMGLITVESNWRASAVSDAGACGLTQVMPKYTGGGATKGVKYTCEQLKKPKTSVKAGASALSWWIQKYGKGDVPTGLCGYYSGFRCKPTLPKLGARYSSKVLKNADKIRKLYAIKSQEHTASD